MKPLLMMHILLIAICLGCASPGYDLSAHDALAVQAEAVTNVAYVVAFSDQLPQPSPKPSPGLCTNCNGTGRIGDGTVSVKCPVCDGRGRITSLENLPVSVAVRQASQAAIAVEASPARSIDLCQCPECTCDECKCAGGNCQCSHCFNAGHKLRDYAAAYKLAKAERIGLLICVGESCDPLDCELEALKRSLIACRPWAGCDSSPGCHAYLWSNDGRLLLADSQPAMNSIKQVNGGRMVCGPSGCQFVPDELSPTANWNSYGGSCANGSCGTSTRSTRRWGR